MRLAFLGLFAYWSISLVAPFLPVVLWSVILAVALYPAYARLAAWLGGRRRIAAFLVTAAAFLVLVGPIAYLAADLALNVQEIFAAVAVGDLVVPPPPRGLDDWPVVGKPAAEIWSLASTNLDAAVAKYGPALLPVGNILLSRIAGIGGDVLAFLVSVVIAGFLFVPGPQLALGVRRFATRLAEPRGAHFVELAGATIRNVSRGIIGIAALQAVLAGIVLVAAGVPWAGMTAFAVLLLGVMQIGPAPVLLPVVIWIWFAFPPVTAAVLTIVLVTVSLVDNVLKPMLVRRGLETPIIVILAGILGGILSFGLIGVFLGPIVLAVFYELAVAWGNLQDE